MTARTTQRRTGGSRIQRSTALERLLIAAAVAAVLVAVGAWVAMSRPGATDVAGARSTASAPSSSAAPSSAAAAPAAAPEEPSAAPPPAAGTPDAPAETAPVAPPAVATPVAATEPAPETFLEAVTDSGLAPPVDDSLKLTMARDVCEEMGYGATPEDMVRALTFAGASDEEAANFVQLAVTNLCPEHAGR
jgi:hypothetical protein